MLTAAYCLTKTMDITLNVTNLLDLTQYRVYIGARNISFLFDGATIPYPNLYC